MMIRGIEAVLWAMAAATSIKNPPPNAIAVNDTV